MLYKINFKLKLRVTGVSRVFLCHQSIGWRMIIGDFSWRRWVKILLCYNHITHTAEFFAQNIVSNQSLGPPPQHRLQDKKKGVSGECSTLTETTQLPFPKQSKPIRYGSNSTIKIYMMIFINNYVVEIITLTSSLQDQTFDQAGVV